MSAFESAGDALLCKRHARHPANGSVFWEVIDVRGALPLTSMMLCGEVRCYELFCRHSIGLVGVIAW